MTGSDKRRSVQSRRATGMRTRLANLVATVVGLLLALMFFVPSSLAQNVVDYPPVFRSMIEVPDYVFENEEAQVTVWQIDGLFTGRSSLAYLILDPDKTGRQHRELILVDRIENPKRGFFLTSPKLRPVPEVKGKPLSGRIDKPLSHRANLVSPNGTVTVNIAHNAEQNEQVQFRFIPALNGYYEKFESIPCLALPDAVTLSRGERTVEFVALLKNVKFDSYFGPRCGPYTDRLKPPTFSYIMAALVRFAFTKTRFFFRTKNYVVSVPYDLNEEAVGRSTFMITRAQLQKVLTDFNDFPNDPDTRPETADERLSKETFAVQHSIDVALIALLKAKGEKR